MSFLWLQYSDNPGLAEYARAYERAVTSGSIDSAISWELGGFKTKDGAVITTAPEEVKATLMKNPKYQQLVLQVNIAVKALRDSRDTANFSHTRKQVAENRI